MVSYNPEYLTQFVNNMSSENFEMLKMIIKKKTSQIQPPSLKDVSQEKATFTPIAHECSVCLKGLTIHDKENMCWMCEEELVSVEKDWPEDAAQAKEYSIFRNGAYHALVLRIRANNCREAAEDTTDTEEVRSCLRDAKRLDQVASHLLYNTADRMFKPWWFASWDHWMQPGSSYNTDKDWAGWRTPEGKPLGPHLLSAEALAQPAQPAEALAQSAHKPKPHYKNINWPSPRPKLFAKTCAPQLKFKKHIDALEFLAERANMSVEDLLKMSPNTYIQEHMGGMKNAPEYWEPYNVRRWFSANQ
jgi:hypothetical protein